MGCCLSIYRYVYTLTCIYTLYNKINNFENQLQISIKKLDNNKLVQSQNAKIMKIEYSVVSLHTS